MTYTIPDGVEVREAPGFPGYLVTSEGIVLGKRGQPLSPRQHARTGHLRVRLYGDHLEPKMVKRRSDSKVRHKSFHCDVYVHVLICAAWHGPPPDDGALVCHENGVSTDNRPENLRWDTPSNNNLDTVDHEVGREHDDAEALAEALGDEPDYTGPTGDGIPF